MEKLALSIVPLIVCQGLIAQTIPNKVETKANQRVNTRIDQGIDKGLDKTEEAIKGMFKKKPKNSGGSSNENKTSQPQNGDVVNAAKPASGQNAGGVNAGSDFVPGTTVIFADNFSKDALNDFPAAWNTNGSGKVVTISGLDGRWLEIAHNTVVHPLLKKPLPENSTIEFDLYLAAEGTRITPVVMFGLTPVKNILTEDVFRSEKFYTTIERYSEMDGHNLEYGLREAIGNKNSFPILSYNNKVMHVSIAINKARIRIYLDETKLIDLPTALKPAMFNNFFLASGYVMPAAEIGMYVANLRIAAADVDARSLLVKELLEKGSASTSDILFDVNKDVIKKESFPIINQIADAMKKDASLKIKIVGHTDNVGNASDNLALSKRRAEAVSSYLIYSAGIDAQRISTDGKGATLPVADNKTPEGKAKNRRVEFVKM
ncbi:MAG TPA: OmpA family protein [Phnomibacter sp.]|nr:OmpA family protein [Phnomibacter sp.]